MMRYSDEFKNFILTRLKDGKGSFEIYEEATKRFSYSSTKYCFCKLCQRVAKNNNLRFGKINGEGIKLEGSISYKQEIKEKLKKYKVLDISKTCEDLGIAKTKCMKIINDLKSSGLNLNIRDNLIFYSSDIEEKGKLPYCLEDRHIIFGIASDLHFGSKQCQITALNEFGEICRSRGVKHILCPGDMVAGFDVYRGQFLDLYALTSDEQEKSLSVNLPTGFTWYMLGGNHDYNFVKKGHDPIQSLSRMRNDIVYVGYDQADIPILKNVDVRMWHPSGGVPYAMSYRLQKGIEQIAFSELRNIVNGVKNIPTVRFVLCGHLHIQMQGMFGPIFGAQCATFEAQTNYLKRKGLDPTIGGWIIEANLGSDNKLKDFDAKFYMFDEKENDFENYNHVINGQNYLNPIFEDEE